MHSTPFSEVAAHVCGFTAGVAAYYLCGPFTGDHALRLKIGIITSIGVNVIVGGHINFLLKDFFGLFIMRPISAYLSVLLLEYFATSMGWVHAAA